MNHSFDDLKIAVAILLMPSELDVAKLAMENLLYKSPHNVTYSILTNGGYSTELAELGKSQQNVYYYSSEENLGVAGGRNFLLEKSEFQTSDVIAILDNDIIPTRDFIRQMTDFLLSDPQHGVVGSSVVDYKVIRDQLTPTQEIGHLGQDIFDIPNSDVKGLLHKYEARVFFYHLGAHKDWEKVYCTPAELENRIARANDRKYEPFNAVVKYGKEIPEIYKNDAIEKIEVSNVAGCTQFFRTRLLREIGMLDNRFNPYGFEDSDFCVRALKRGYRNYTSTKIFLLHGTDNRHFEKWNSPERKKNKQEMLYKGFTIMGMKHGGPDYRNKVKRRMLAELINSADKENFAHAASGFKKAYSGSKQVAEAARDDYDLNIERIEQFRDLYKGQRCFIVGNGPSLKKMDLSVLNNEYTFGLNRIYLLFEQTGFLPTFFVSVNNLVIRQFWSDMEALPMPKFIEHNCRGDITPNETTYFLKYAEEPKFYESFNNGIWHGATVTYVAMQLAYFMGFSEVYLIGVDHSFKVTGNAHEAQVSQEDDANHFHPNYFGKGIKWNLPDLETSEIAYKIAKDHYEDNGRRIYNATVGGKLEVFDRVEFETLFNKAGYP